MKKAIFAAAVALFALLPSAAFAREHNAYQIGGNLYEIIVDEIGEPVAVDDKSGIEVQVNNLGPATDGKVVNVDKSGKPTKVAPAAGLDQTLKVEVSAAGQKKTFDLIPAFNTPGMFGAQFDPTQATNYSYRFFGTVDNTPVDLTFDCADIHTPPTQPDTTPKKISDSVTRYETSGIIPCPVDRSQVTFPQQNGSVQQLFDQYKSVTQRQSRSLAIGLAALALSVLGLIMTIHHRSKHSK